MSSFRIRARREIRRQRARRFARGLAWGFSVPAIILLIAFAFFRPQIGVALSDVVRSQARAFLNGSLDFSTMHVDLAGRAVFEDAVVRNVDGEALISTPRAVVGFDPKGLLRGQRAITLHMHEPHLLIERRADGTLNLADLLREPTDPDRIRTPWGITLRISGGTVDFTDAALLRHGYPQWELQGLTAEIFNELGYDSTGPPDTPPLQERINLTGSFRLDPDGAMALDAVLRRASGRLRARGTMLDEGRGFDFRFSFRDTELASLSPYINSLFPNLEVLPSGPPTDGGDSPQLAGLMRTAAMRLWRGRGESIALTMDTDLASAYFSGDDLPPLRFNRLKVGYDGQRSRLATDFELHTAGSTVIAAPVFHLETGTVEGDLKIETDDLRELQLALGLTGPALGGRLSVDGSISGKLGLPDVRASVEGSGLTVDGQPLGTLAVNGSFVDGQLDLPQLRLGGALPLTGSAQYSMDSGDGAARLRAGPLDAGAAVRLLGALGLDPPPMLAGASGALSATTDLSMSEGRISGTASINSEQLAVAGQTLKGVGVEVSLARSLLTIQSAQATLVASNFDGFGVRSVGPLRVALRASGTAQLPPTAPPTLDITFTAGTLNLAPEQAGLTASISGPLAAPRFDARLTTTAREQPLVLTAQGTYADRAAPLSAVVEWADMRASYEGSANLAQQSVDGTLTASAIDLGAILPGRGYEGIINASAQISGPLAAPTVDGRVTAPYLAFGVNVPTLPAPVETLEDALPEGEWITIARSDSARDTQGPRGAQQLDAAIEAGAGQPPPVVPPSPATRRGAQSAAAPMQPAAEQVACPKCPPRCVKCPPDCTACTRGCAQCPPLTAAPTTATQTERHSELETAEDVQESSRIARALPPDEELLEPETLAVDEAVEGVELVEVDAEPAIVVEEDVDLILADAAPPPPTAGPSERRVEITDLDVQFRLVQGRSLSVPEGRLTFAGSRFDISGQITAESDNELLVRSENFDLAPLLAFVHPSPTSSIPQLDASGPLELAVSGTLADPRARVSFASGPGNIDGREFDNAVLQASASTRGLSLERLGIEGPLGSLNVTGDAWLTRAPGMPDRGIAGLRLNNYEFHLDVNQLRARMITPLLGQPVLEQLTGTLFGDLTIAGTDESFNLDGDLTLASGQFNMVPIDEAYVRFATRGTQVVIEEAYFETGEARLAASGTIGPGPGELNITAGAESLDLGLLEPFMPDVVGEFSGHVSLALNVSPPTAAGGYPQVEVAIRDIGDGVVMGGIRFSELSLAASLRENLLVIDEARVVTHGSTLEMGGTISPAMLAGAAQPGAGRRNNVPLNFWLETADFRLGVLRPLLPEAFREMLPVGTLTADLSLTGRLSDPQLTGSLAFNITQMPADMPVQVDNISGTLTFANNRFEIGELKIGGAAGEAIAGVQITGGGLLSLRPPRLLDGAINVLLAPEGQYARVQYAELFEGTLGGMITIQPPRATNGLHVGQRPGVFSIGGQVVVNPGGGTSRLILRIPETDGGGGVPACAFNDFRVQVEPGTEAVFSGYGVDLLAEMTGALTINGAMGAPGNQALSVAGELAIPRGGVNVYRHNIRLTGDDNYMRFNGVPGDPFPYFTGQGAIVLAGVLRGTETFDLGGADQLVRPGERELTVYFTFNRFKLGPGGGLGGMAITSDPPLPESEIRAYMLGGFQDALLGRAYLGQFASSELMLFGGSFISRQIARQFDLDQFSFGGLGTNDNPFYVNVEKEISPNLYLGYFSNFYTETNQREDWWLRYRFFHSHLNGHAQNASAQVTFRQSGLMQDEIEFMLRYNIRFGAGGRPDPAAPASEATEVVTTADTPAADTPAGVVSAETDAPAPTPTAEERRRARDPDAPPAVPPSRGPENGEATEIIIGTPRDIGVE